MLFNKSPQFESFVFSKPYTSSDNKSFIACKLRNKESGSTDVLCQFNGLLSKTQLTADSSVLEVCTANEDVIDFIGECDDHILAYARDNKGKWFTNDTESQEISDTHVNDSFMPSIKQVKKQHVFKIRTSKHIEVFDSSKNAKELTSVTENSKISVIVQLSGLWFTKSRFGITWKVKQIKIHEPKSHKIGKCLIDDDEDEYSEEVENVFPDE